MSWIKLQERLPPEGSPVLAYIPKWDCIEVVSFLDEFGWSWCGEFLRIDYFPSHWQPLPEKP
jgi:hypothetical protein